MPILSTKISTQNPKALRIAATIGNLCRKYHEFWRASLEDLSRWAHKKAQAHEGAAEDLYDAAASLHRHADFLEAKQREADALAVRDHLASLLACADDELLACRQEASATAHALSPEDIADLGL